MTHPADKGFVLVPVEPTPEMIELGMMAYNLTGLPGDAISTAEEHLTLIYEALTSKAPSPVLSGEAGEMVERLRYRVNNPSAWPEGFDQRGSDLFADAASLISTLVRERDDQIGINKELIRHAREAGMSYREDEFGAPYFINARAEATQREVERLRGVLAEFIDHHNEGPGLIDCIDNDGDRYTSQGLADTINRARAALDSHNE